MTTVERYLEAGYALIVAGAAMIYPPAALAVAAVFLIALAVVADRREATRLLHEAQAREAQQAQEAQS